MEKEKNSDTWTCAVCGEEMDRRRQKEHESFHNEFRKECPYKDCHRMFTSEQRYFAHVKRGTKDTCKKVCRGKKDILMEQVVSNFSDNEITQHSSMEKLDPEPQSKRLKVLDIELSLTTETQTDDNFSTVKMFNSLTTETQTETQTPFVLIEDYNNLKEKMQELQKKYKYKLNFNKKRDLLEEVLQRQNPQNKITPNGKDKKIRELELQISNHNQHVLHLNQEFEQERLKLLHEIEMRNNFLQNQDDTITELKLELQRVKDEDKVQLVQTNSN